MNSDQWMKTAYQITTVEGHQVWLQTQEVNTVTNELTSKSKSEV